MADKTYKLTATLSTGEKIDCGTFTAPQGEPGAPGTKGDPGAAATVQVGTTTTGKPGTQASVENVGTSSAAVLNFTIPRGADGTGAQLNTIVFRSLIANVNFLVAYLDENGVPQSITVNSLNTHKITIRGNTFLVTAQSASISEFNLFVGKVPANQPSAQIADIANTNSVALTTYIVSNPETSISFDKIVVANNYNYISEVEIASNLPINTYTCTIVAPIDLVIDYAEPQNYNFVVGFRAAQT